MLLFYIVISIIIMSFVEWFAHRHIMHYPSLSVFKQIQYNHAQLHHREYFEKFNYEQDEAGRQLNIKLDLGYSLLMGIPVFLVFYLLSSLFCLTFIAIFVLHHLTWNIIHDEMHNPVNNWRRRLPGFSFLERYHWLHHKYPGKNYNVVFPLFDYIFNTNIKASAKDILQMKGELK